LRRSAKAKGRWHSGDHAAFLTPVRWDTVDMTPQDADIDKIETEDPIEDQPAEWAKENRNLEHREPDLGEIEEDPTED